jgi:putative transcriptional regulator
MPESAGSYVSENRYLISFYTFRYPFSGLAEKIVSIKSFCFNMLEVLAVVHAQIAPRKVREQAKMTQAQMASLMGMSLSGYRKWEQGQRRVSGPAAALLRLIQKEPNVVKRALLS